MNIRKLMDDTLRKLGYAGACYTVSKIISIVLNRKGIQAQVVFVQGIIANKEAENFRQDSGINSWRESTPSGFVEQMIALGGHTIAVGIGKDIKGKPNFHAVVYLPQTDMVIDATMEQMTRVEKGIILKPFYGKRKEYRNLFSPGARFCLMEIEDIILKIFKPMIEREPKICKRIINELLEDTE